MKKPTMNDKTLREQAIRAVTDDLLTSRFTTELGQKARVERSELSGEHMDQLREVVCEVGRNLSETGQVPRGMEYVGSLSIHIYKSEILKTAAFASVNSLASVPFDLADGALRELTGATLEAYGKRRQKLRSGF